MEGEIKSISVDFFQYIAIKSWALRGFPQQRTELGFVEICTHSQAARGSNVANPSKVFFSVDSTISECTFKDSS